jgi:hypothetical protein
MILYVSFNFNRFFSCFVVQMTDWIVSCLKLDFEDEPPDDDDGIAASDEERENDSDSDSDEEDGAFEDAMENLTISDQPRLVAATA